MNNGFELKKTDEKGEGIFAAKMFQPEDTVMIGIIEKKLDRNDSHASQVGENKYVRHGGLISKVNHSCNPNCGIKVNKTGGHDFVAMKKIDIGEEVTFDYAMRNYSIDHFLTSCQCGSEKCRQKITGWKNLSKETKKKYAGFVAPYLLDLDRKYALK